MVVFGGDAFLFGEVYDPQPLLADGGQFLIAPFRHGHPHSR